MDTAFNLEKYMKLQSEKILDRVSKFDKLYLEFGGKLFDDYHASRVLPGFLPDSKLKMLLTIKDRVEILIVINAKDIIVNRVRQDLNTSYDAEVFRLIDAFRDSGLYVGSVVISRYISVETVDRFIKKLNNLGIKTYKHYEISSYPHDTEKILSEDGFGKNEYVITSKPIVVVTAPGPGSGKMGTCLSQLYHENKRGINAGYAKFETFPIWNLPLDHLLNLAYEAATVNLSDVNMIDFFHLEKYNVLATNYNRDIEVFPILKTIFEKIYGQSPYYSPTDMGVNMIGFCIEDEEKVNDACRREIVRRYLNTLIDLRNGAVTQNAVDKLNLIIKKAGTSLTDRITVAASRKKAEELGVPCAAIELPDGRLITGKTSDLFNCASSVLINALKVVSNIDDNLELIPHSIILPIQKYKQEKMNNHHPRLHADEVLIALAISAETNPLAELAMKHLTDLRSSELHSTTIFPESDARIFRKLNINVTTDPYNQGHRLYPKKEN